MTPRPTPLAEDRRVALDLLCGSATAREKQRALDVICTAEDDVTHAAIRYALASEKTSLKLKGFALCEQRPHVLTRGDVHQAALGHPSWLLRRAAVRMFPQVYKSDSWPTYSLAYDPHWRVRHAFVEAVADVAQTRPKVLQFVMQELNWRRESCREITEKLGRPIPENPFAVGVRAALARRLGLPEEVGPDRQVHPLEEEAYWDWDGAVMARDLAQHATSDVRPDSDAIRTLINHPHPSVRAIALRTLEESGTAADLVTVSRWLGRTTSYGHASVSRWLTKMPFTRRKELIEALHADKSLSGGRNGRYLPETLKAWIVDQFEQALPPLDVAKVLSRRERWVGYSQTLMASLLRYALRSESWERSESFLEYIVCLNRWGTYRVWPSELFSTLAEHPTRIELNESDALVHCTSASDRTACLDWLTARGSVPEGVVEWATDIDHRVRARLARFLIETDAHHDVLQSLQADPLPLVRAAATDRTRAKELLADPSLDESEIVRTAAADRLRKPDWIAFPKSTGEPDANTADEPEPLIDITIGLEWTRREMRGLGWRVTPLGLSGHYGLPVEGFVEGVSRGVNVLFWEPNYDTLTDFFRRAAPTLRSELKLILGTFECTPEKVRADVDRALRMLNRDQISLFLLFWTRSWDRFDDDLRKCIDDLLASGKVANISLSTHDRNLALEAIGREWNPVMVRHSAAHRKAEELIFPAARDAGCDLITFSTTCYGRLLGPDKLTARDCYRYTLAFPEVKLCLTAPATVEQMRENLSAMDADPLTDAELTRIRAVGAALYQEEKAFDRNIKSLDDVPILTDPSTESRACKY